MAAPDEKNSFEMAPKVAAAQPDAAMSTSAKKRPSVVRFSPSAKSGKAALTEVENATAASVDASNSRPPSANTEAGKRVPSAATSTRGQSASSVPAAAEPVDNAAELETMNGNIEDGAPSTPISSARKIASTSVVRVSSAGSNRSAKLLGLTEASMTNGHTEERISSATSAKLEDKAKSTSSTVDTEKLIDVNDDEEDAEIEAPEAAVAEPATPVDTEAAEQAKNEAFENPDIEFLGGGLRRRSLSVTKHASASSGELEVPVNPLITNVETSTIASRNRGSQETLIEPGLKPALWKRARAKLRISYFWRQRAKIDEGYRIVRPNYLLETSSKDGHIQHGKRYAGNSIKTTKYTFLTFVPKNLYEQFHRFANLYFVAMVLLNWVPEIEVFGKEITMIPILFVLSVTALKDFFEDRRRYVADGKVNNAICNVFSAADNDYKPTKWKDLRVGDIVKLVFNEVIPADILLLHSSDPSGMCYVETSNLDGESNLKQRYVVPSLSEKLKFSPTDFRSTIECEQPNNVIEKFNGFLAHPNCDKHESINKNHLLLRGCQIRNTDFVEGIVVYAGHETKAMLNNSGPRYKRSKLEMCLNWDIVWCVVVLVVLCFVGAIGNGLWQNSFGTHPPALFLPTSNQGSMSELRAFIGFWSFIIILQVMIPISLYVTIEIVKLGQIFFITQDAELKHRESGKETQCRALNIPEELGQIAYVMCDKTGTLTENQMIFRRCTVASTDYEPFSTNSHAEQHGFTSGTRIHETAKDVKANPELKQLLLSTSDDFQSGKLQSHKRLMTTFEFFVNLAICNTVVVSAHSHAKKEESNDTDPQPPVPDCLVAPSPLPPELPLHLDSGVASLESTVSSCATTSTTISSRSSSSLAKKPPHKLPPLVEEPKTAATFYEAESPDELALVYAAAAYGVKLLKRQPNYVSVALPGGARVRYEVLHILPFDSVRKRMSVIVREPISKQIILYCKGADSVILDLLSRSFQRSKRGEKYIVKSAESLNLYASYGLRTLCIVRRILSENEYAAWLVDHHIADLAIEHRDQLLRDSAERIEMDFELLGVTGIEDRLQDGVAECIESLRSAGMKVWVLTGDKVETAVNIAYACRLFAEGMELIQLSAKNEEDTDALLHHHVDALMRPRRRKGAGPDSGAKLALVIDGKTLAFCLHPRLQDKFVQLIAMFTAVLCCRATPLQKGAVVKLVKSKLHALTLAIGDGANDVSMIQCADVGIGISGQEGMQAVMASDFAMPRFRFLTRLLLVHGHWCYDRLARLVLYFFYKNDLFVFTVFWFQMFNGWSAQIPVDALYMTFFNLIFTSVPVALLGIVEQDCDQETLLKYPSLYKQGIDGALYRTHSFWVNLLDSLWQATTIFFVSYFTYAGSDVDLWKFGLLVTTSLVLCAQFHIATEIRCWTGFMVAGVAASIFAFYFFALVYNGFAATCCDKNPPYWIAENLFSDPVYWITQTLIVVLAILPRFTLQVIQNSICPSDVVLAQLKERELRSKKTKKNIEAATTEKASSKKGWKPFWKRRKPERGKTEMEKVSDEASGQNAGLPRIRVDAVREGPDGAEEPPPPLSTQ